MFRTYSVRIWVLVCFILLARILNPSPVLFTALNQSSVDSAHTIPAGNHEPIRIDSDDDFAEQGWPGNGTEANPYVIASLNITSEIVPISISDTRSHFVIDSCTLVAIRGGNCSLHLRNVSHGRLIDCTIRNAKWGIWLRNGLNFSITGNNIRNCSYGIHMRTINSSLISLNEIVSCNQRIDVIECMSCTFRSNAVYGNMFCFWLSTGLSIKNNAIWNAGIAITDCDRTHIIGNSIFSENHGISIDSSPACVVSDNAMAAFGISLTRPSSSAYSYQITNNTVGGKPIGYFHNISNTFVDCREYGQIVAVGCNNTSFKYGFFQNVHTGILLFLCWNSVVRNITAVSCVRYGIHLLASWRCTIEKNVVRNITKNPPFPGAGIKIQSGHECRLSCNRLYWNTHGIDAASVQESLFTYNAIYNNTRYGIYMYFSYNNHIFGNKIGWNGDENAFQVASNCTWDNGDGLGNHWSDYNGTNSYPIEGYGAGVDRFPRKLSEGTPHMPECVPRIGFSVIIIGVAAVVVIAIVGIELFIRNGYRVK